MKKPLVYLEIISIITTLSLAGVSIRSPKLVHPLSPIIPLTIGLGINIIKREKNQPSITQAQELQKNLIRLESKFKNLPPAFDPSSIESELQSYRQQLSELSNVRDLRTSISQLQQKLSTLESRFENLPPAFDPSPIQLELQRHQQQFSELSDFRDFRNLISQLQQKLSTLESRLRGIEALELNSKISVLQVNGASNIRDLKTSISQLQRRISGLENRFESLPPTFDPSSIESELQSYRQQLSELEENLQRFFIDLQTSTSYEYVLIRDRQESRETLLEILEHTRRYIILVNPWLTTYGIDNNVVNKFRRILSRQGTKICIGWGHLSDIQLNQMQRMTRQEFLRRASERNRWGYSALETLETFERDYPDRFQLKLLGTHEKYLVSDDQVAMIGSHNFLTSGNHTSERETGIRTNNPQLIQQLVLRFQDARNFEITNPRPPLIF